VTPRDPRPASAAASRRAAVSHRAAQAWIELLSPDPEATSALAVARAHLPGGRFIRSLRRLRLLEIVGPLPGPEAIGELLHRSIQFYNPRKERCTVRAAAGDPAPLRAGEAAVLVVERGATRRPAAERWWHHETGQPVAVREGLAWAVAFDDAGPAREQLEALAVVRDRRHGLLCNPQAQDHRIAGAEVPLPWIEEEEPPPPARQAARGGTPRRKTRGG